jgi:hypothetical protein
MGAFLSVGMQSRSLMSPWGVAPRPSDVSSGISASASAAGTSDGTPLPDAASTSILARAPPWIVNRLSEYALMNRTSSSGQCQIFPDWTPVVLLTHNEP